MGIKGLLSLAAVLALLAAGVYTYGREELAPTSAMGKSSIQWQFTDNGYSEDIFANTTSVTLILNGTSYDAGTYSGSCWELGADTDPLLDGELSGVQCWFAGGGDEVGVFSEYGQFVVKHGLLEEPQGDGTPAFRGAFETLFTIER